MLCDKIAEIQFEHADEMDTISFAMLAAEIARQFNWGCSWSKEGTFLCCDTCCDLVFDKSQGGRVGFLKDEYRHLCQPSEQQY
jgi:hypothetical protein